MPSKVQVGKGTVQQLSKVQKRHDEAIATHNASAHFQKFAGAFMPMLAKAPVIEQVVEA